MSNTLTCPNCKVKLGISIEKDTRSRGHFAMIQTRNARMAVECTPERHKEKARTMNYCNYCHRTISLVV